jgi:SPW repeat
MVIAAPRFTGAVRTSDHEREMSRMGGDVSHRAGDLSSHPDVHEMRARYARVLSGRGEVAVDGLVTIAGLYCAISPWVIHFSGTRTDLMINNLILGIAVALIGVGLSMAPERMRGMSLAMAAIGVWLIISPWVVTRSPTVGMISNNVVTGAVICLLGLVATMATMAIKRNVHHTA